MTELNDTFRELLLETGIDDSELVSSTLSVSQQRVISLRKEGKNIFFYDERDDLINLLDQELENIAEKIY